VEGAHIVATQRQQRQSEGDVHRVGDVEAGRGGHGVGGEPRPVRIILHPQLLPTLLRRLLPLQLAGAPLHVLGEAEAILGPAIDEFPTLGGEEG